MRLPFRISITPRQLLTRWLCRGDIVALTLHPDGHLGIELADGRHSSATVAPGTTVFPTLIVLRLQTGRRIESLVLIPAMTGSDAHRRLRVWLDGR